MEIKIPLYNILNMFLTGLVFIGGILIIFPEYALTVLNNEVIKSLGTGPEIVITVSVFATAYEIGLIINRAGSVFVEKPLKLLKLIPFNDNYTLFNNRKKQYPIMSVLSREYALSRTGITLFFILFVLAFVAHKWPIVIACAAITFIYYLSCRKHSAKIMELMESTESINKESHEKNCTRS